MQARAMGAAILDIMDDLEAAVGKLVPYHVGSVTIQPFPDIDPEYYRDLCKLCFARRRLFLTVNEEHL